MAMDRKALKEKKELKRKERRRKQREEKQRANSLNGSGGIAPGVSTGTSTGAPSGASTGTSTGAPSASRRAAPDHRIFVGRLPQSVTKATLHTLFASCGTLQEVDMVVHPGTSRFRGAAFIAFADAAGATAALAKDGERGDGKIISVQVAGQDQGTDPSPVGGQKRARAVGGKTGSPKKAKSDQSKWKPAVTTTDGAGKSVRSIFVEGFSKDAEYHDLRNALRQCGPIQKVKLLGGGKGFVDFVKPSSAAAAVALDGSTVEGTTLTVRFSQKKCDAASGGGRRSAQAKQRRRMRREDTRQGIPQARATT